MDANNFADLEDSNRCPEQANVMESQQYNQNEENRPYENNCKSKTEGCALQPKFQNILVGAPLLFHAA